MILNAPKDVGETCQSRAYDVSASYLMAVIYGLFNEQGETEYLAIIENTSF
jgi:hypothetical protein